MRGRPGWKKAATSADSPTTTTGPRNEAPGWKKKAGAMLMTRRPSRAAAAAAAAAAGGGGGWCRGCAASYVSLFVRGRGRIKHRLGGGGGGGRWRGEPVGRRYRCWPRQRRPIMRVCVCVCVGLGKKALKLPGVSRISASGGPPPPPPPPPPPAAPTARKSARKEERADNNRGLPRPKRSPGVGGGGVARRFRPAPS